MSLTLRDLGPNGYHYSVTSGTVVESTDIPAVSENSITADFSVSSMLTCSTDFTDIDTHDFTVELWLKQKAAAGDRVLFAKNGADGQIYIQDSDTVVTQINSTSVVSTSTITTTSWTHLAFAYNKTAGTIKIYKDGALLETLTSHSTNGIPNNASAAVISSPAANGFYIDEYRIWSTERTITEIQNNKDVKLNGNETGLVLYLPFELRPIQDQSYSFFM